MAKLFNFFYKFVQHGLSFKSYQKQWSLQKNSSKGNTKFRSFRSPWEFLDTHQQYLITAI